MEKKHEYNTLINLERKSAVERKNKRKHREKKKENVNERNVSQT